MLTAEIKVNGILIGAATIQRREHPPDSADADLHAYECHYVRLNQVVGDSTVDIAKFTVLHKYSEGAEVLCQLVLDQALKRMRKRKLKKDNDAAPRLWKAKVEKDRSDPTKRKQTLTEKA